MRVATLERPTVQKTAQKNSNLRKRYSLRDLVAGMSEDRCGEIEVGPAKGREFGA
jgi:hypothetical protein